MGRPATGATGRPATLLLWAWCALAVAAGRAHCHDGHEPEASATETSPAESLEHELHAHQHGHQEQGGEAAHLEEHKNNEKLRGHRQQPLSQPRKPLNYRLEWVEEPEVVHGYGERKLITQCITTGEKPSETQVSTSFLHTFEVESSGVERHLEEFVQRALDELAAKFNLTRKRAQRSQLKQKFLFDRRSKAVVMFRDQVIKLEGKVRKVYNDSCAGQGPQLGQLSRQQISCAKAHKQRKATEFDLSIRATEVDEQGKARGAFSIEYFGLDKFRHPQFYNLADRFAELDEPLAENAEDVRSPYQCAELAVNASKLIALYDVVHMSCAFGEPATPGRLNGKAPVVFSLDRTGKPIGNYTFTPADPAAEGAARALESTDARATLDKWAADKRCDLVNAINGLYTCLKFEERPASVLMFRRA